jgi:tetratricopeptide (TPR) repeat protein
MWPRVKVAMDSRNDVYGETVYLEYVGALSGGRALEAYLRKWPVDFFLITYGGDRNPEFFRWLDASPDWKRVYFDDRAVVYVKNIPRFQHIIARDAYEMIDPALGGTTEIKTEDAPRWLAEAERAVAAAPGEWSPLQYKAKALMALGRLDEAEGAIRALLERNPSAYFAWADLGFIDMMRDQPGEAEKAFTECLRLSPAFSPCQEYLARLRDRR